MAVNNECPSNDLSVLSLYGYPQHTPVMHSVLGYRQHQIDWGNGWNNSLVIIAIVILGYPPDMASKFAVHQTLFWFCIYFRPHLSPWAMFNLDLPIVNFFFDIEILHLDMLCLFHTTHFTISFQQNRTHIVLI
jgi:hypothetical protein